MAAGHYRSIKTDPAVERWQAMHNTMYTRFRWTRQNTGPILIWALAVPAITYAVFANTNYRWDLRGKTKSESLMYKTEPAAEEQGEDA